MASISETLDKPLPGQAVSKEETQQVAPSIVKKSKLLGCLSETEVLPQGDSEQKRLVARHQDPFRMSVLDFQHRAMERLAEILKIFLLKHQKDDLDKEDQNDIQELIKYLRDHKTNLAKDLGYSNEKEMKEVCKKLLTVRNSFAHQKYVKGEVTPKAADSNALEKSREKKPEYKYVYKVTRSFEKTKEIIEKCKELATKVKEYMDKSPMNDTIREVIARCDDLSYLATMFEEFKKYRGYERENLEAFHVHLKPKEKKDIALQVLKELQSQIETGEDSEKEDLCELVACVFAPRASLTIKCV